MTEDKSPLPRDEEPKPVVWTPEDASRFLTAAIHEAQRPLADALQQRPVTTRVLAIIVCILVAGAAVIGLILSSQLEKAEKRTASAQSDREKALQEKMALQAQSHVLETRLHTATAAMAKLQTDEGEFRKAKADLQRAQRQNRLLLNQITGLEMEKRALAHQLEAVKAMAFDDDGDALADLRDAAPAPHEAHDAPAAPGDAPGQGALTVSDVRHATPVEAVAELVEAPAEAPEQPAATDSAPPAPDAGEADAASRDNPPALYEAFRLFGNDAAAPDEKPAATATEPEAAAETPETPDAEKPESPEQPAETPAPADAPAENPETEEEVDIEEPVGPPAA